MSGSGREVGQKRLFQNSFASVWVSERRTDTDVNTVSVNDTPGIAAVSDFITERPKNVFFKRFVTRSYICLVFSFGDSQFCPPSLGFRVSDQ